VIDSAIDSPVRWRFSTSEPAASGPAAERPFVRVVLGRTWPTIASAGPGPQALTGARPHDEDGAACNQQRQGDQQMTAEQPARAERASGRRLVTLGLVLAVIAFGGLLARRSFPALDYPSSHLISWELEQGLGASRTADAASVVWVSIVWPPRAPTPPDASWLEPLITYTPLAVMITLHSSIPVGCDSTTLPCVGTYLSTIAVPIRLSEPLAGRTLFDGSTFPPAVRGSP
jgi:hypothetical protein